MSDSPTIAVNYRPLVHDLRNLFAVITSAVNLMEDARSPAARQLLLNALRDAAQRGAASTDRLLAPARSGPVGPVDLLRLCLGMRPLLVAAAGDCDLHLELSGSAAAVRIDPTRFEQTILELVTNARKATRGHGRITVRIHPAHGRVWIEVADRGRGLKAPDRSVAPPKAPGMHGSGLPIISDFVTSAHGRWRIFSAPGRGTIVAISLPGAFGLTFGERAKQPSSDDSRAREALSREERQPVAA